MRISRGSTAVRMSDKMSSLCETSPEGARWDPLTGA